MNSRNRKKYFLQIVQRDGEAYCFIGGEPLTLETAVIDHWDNDNSNNDLDNLHLTCKSMNAVKNPRGRDKRHRVLSPMCGNVYQQLFESDRPKTIPVEIQKNMQAEPDFRHWLFWKVVHDGSVLFEDALDGGAAFARCSQESIRRYLKKEVSEVRLYRFVEGPDTNKKLVDLKPEWAVFRDKEEEKRKMSRVVRNWKELLSEDPSRSVAKGKQKDKESEGGEPSR
jgi:hypothetical protein